MKKLALFLTSIYIFLFYQNLECAFSASQRVKVASVLMGASAAAVFKHDFDGKYIASKEPDSAYKSWANYVINNLHSRNLLVHNSSQMLIKQGEKLCITGFRKPCLNIKQSYINEFEALHEGAHVNEKHLLQSIAMSNVAFFMGLYSKRPMLAASCLVALSQFVLGKNHEYRADTFAAENCSSAKDFRSKISDYKQTELGWIKHWQDKLQVSASTAKFVNFLTDEHVPLVGYRADRLQQIYDRRIKEGSLIE